MATDVIMPQMGESITEGTLTRWLVQVGERVERDQPLFEVSTDKVDAEIPSPAAGVLLEVKFEEGSVVHVDDVVARIGEKGEQEESAAESAPETARPGAGVQASAPAAEVEASPPPSEDTSQAGAREADFARPAVESGSAEEAGDGEPDAAADRLRRFSSPLVRRMAADEGIDLTAIEGTGIHGRVTKRDIETYLEQREDATGGEAAPAPQARTAELVAPEKPKTGDFFVAPYRDTDRVDIEPMSNIRRLTAAHMSYSKHTSAHVTTVFHIDMSRVVRARNRARHGFLAKHGTKLTYMPFIFKAVANALMANRKLNASIDGTDIVYKKDVNIGMAVALDWGLIVPVIRHADQLNLVGLARTANDLADRARTKKLSPDEVQGGTFTVTNPGVFGSLFGTPIINQPQVAILGIGAIEKRPVVDTDADGNDTIAIKTMSYFSITYDHRLVDGADADQFMNHLHQTLLEESWSELDAFD